jgi:hypothetical protein
MNKHRPADVFRRANRGLLLDLFVLVLNIFLMHYLSKLFFEVIRNASADDKFSQAILFAGSLALFVLPPLGATLKRWHFHERLKAEGKADPGSEGVTLGCLFNPILYFSLTAVIFATINAFIFQFLFGDNEPEGPFISSIFVGLGLMIFNTVLVYRYFSPPKSAPKTAFFRSRASEIIGDICIFTNMLLFQLVWNMLTLGGFTRVSDVWEFLGRSFFLVFVALLIYFPPRIFYLAEDIGKRRTWIMIVLANLPVIIRVLFGTGEVAGW